MSNIRTVFETVEMTVSLLGLAFNLFQFYLIAKHTTPAVKPYSPILYQNSVIDCIYIFAALISRIQADVRNGIVFYTLQVPYFKNQEVVLLSATFWIFSIAFYVSGVPVQFVYRYLYIIRFIKVPKIVHMSMLFIAGLVSYLICSFYYLAFRDSPNIAAKSIQILQVSDGPSNTTFQMLSSYVTNIYLAIYLGLACLALILSGIIILIATVLFAKHINRNYEVMSQSTREASAQVTIILIVQTAVPVFVCIILVTFVFQVFLSLNSSTISMIIIPVVSFFPMLNSILVIYFMKSYRTFIAQKLLGIYATLLP
uniref:G_PROTEIN_RECEP_F1_2 domain-containing protein n=1 Tax=Panagrellus redivivus TaxID=6233 RepID=A0A7E4VZK3_PANRE